MSAAGLTTLLRDQGILLLSLRERIAELETLLEGETAKNTRLEVRVAELIAEIATLRGGPVRE